MTNSLLLDTLSADMVVRWNKLVLGGKLGPLHMRMDDMIEKTTRNSLVQRYTEAFRRYHTFSHIKRMLDELDKHRNDIKHPEEVEFAIFLHDIYYVPGDKKNETNSSIIARKWLYHLGANKTTVRRITRLINVATKHPKSPKARLTNDEKYMSDFDLYGFSLSWDTVLGQTGDVRREFSEFSDEQFRKGNGDFIMSMMRKPVYLTEYYKQYEMFAKDNMAMILKNMDQVVMARPTDKRL